MEFVLALFTGIGLSAACGFRVFLTPLIMGIAHNTGHLSLSPSFEWMGSPVALITLTIATLVEVVAYFFPVVDNFLDMTVATPLAFVAGTLATAAIVGDIGDVSPFLKWIIAAIAGGGVASAIQGATVSIRGISTSTTAGTVNAGVAAGELGAASIVSMVAILAPIAVVVIVGAILTGSIWILIKMKRKLFASRKQTAT